MIIGLRNKMVLIEAFFIFYNFNSLPALPLQVRPAAFYKDKQGRTDAIVIGDLSYYKIIRVASATNLKIRQ